MGGRELPLPPNVSLLVYLFTWHSSFKIQVPRGIYHLVPINHPIELLTFYCFGYVNGWFFCQGVHAYQLVAIKVHIKNCYIRVMWMSVLEEMVKMWP